MDSETRTMRAVVWFIVAVIVIVILVGTFGSVPAGSRGVLTTFNAVSGIKGEGFYMKLPIVQKVRVMNFQTHTFEATKDSPLEAASSDQQDVFLQAAVSYHVTPSSAPDIYAQYGGDMETYYSKIIDPIVFQVIKANVSQYTAADALLKRDELSSKIQAELVLRSQNRNFVFEQTSIKDVSFSPDYSKAIERKAIAVQDAEAAKNKLVQVQAEADQRVAQANGEAEAIKIQAQAINSQGGADYVELQRIKAWDGHACTSYCGVTASTGLLVQSK